MNILTIVQNFLIGGLETRIQGEIKWANDHGHETYLATSNLVVVEGVPYTTLGRTIGLDIGDSASISGVLNAVDRLVEIVKEKNIGVIHAHPFGALLPAMLASQLTRIPLVVSLHGPTSLSPMQRGAQWRIQLAFALTHASLIACVSPEVKELAVRLVCHERIKILPNCVDLQKFSPSPGDKIKGRWVLVSRLDRDKKDGILKFLNVTKLLQIHVLDVIGDGECRGELEEYARSSLNQFSSIRFLGASQQIASDLTEYDVVAGMGRVVLEAVAMSIPVVLVGYDGVKGWIDKDLFVKAAYTNFSGRGLENATESELTSWPDVRNSRELASLRGLLLSKYNEQTLWEGAYSDFSALRFVRCGVTDGIIEIFRRFSGSSVPYCEHQDLVKEIESFLCIKERELSLGTEGVVNVASYADFRNISEMARGWRIGALDESRLSYESQIDWRDKEISRIKNSISWRMTRPVRFFQAVADRVRKTVA